MKRSKIRPRGARGRRLALADAAWRCLVLARDGHKCMDCLRPADDAHHVFSKQAHPSLRWALCNGISLCRECHRWAEDHPTWFNGVMASRWPVQWAELQAAKFKAEGH